MKNDIEKALNLAKITGDRVIVVDRDLGRSFVIISLDEYEKLAVKNSGIVKISDLTEDELLDKINRDIASWRQINQTKEEETNNTDFSKEIIEEEDEEVEEDNTYYYSQEDGEENSFKGFSPNFSLKSLEEDIEEGKGVNDWNISRSVKKKATIIEE